MTDHDRMSPEPIYVYESSDSGDTMYRRLAGTNQREMVREGPLRKKMLRSQLWRDIFHAAETDPVLQEMIEQVEVYHRLKNTLP
jgi:hypothetical protein